MKKTYKLGAVITFCLVFILAIAKPDLISELFDTDNSNQEADYVLPSPTIEDTGEQETLTYYFRNETLRSQHFQKHGGEFPYQTAEEYEQGANRVIETEGVLHKKEAEDNDDVYYLESTNEFVIVSTDGYIRTYFKPGGGIDYYNRQ